MRADGFGACKKWHAEQNAKLRSCENIEKWFVAQVSEGYLSHVNDILFGLEDASELERADFVVSPHVASAKCQDDIRSEDDFANCAAMYHLNLVSQRLRRGVYILEGGLIRWPEF